MNGGQASQRGFLCQTIVCILDSLKDNNWKNVEIEPLSKNGQDLKADIKWYDEEGIKATQVKSSIHPFSKKNIVDWLSQLIETSSSDVKEYNLYLVGTFQKEIIDFKRKINKNGKFTKEEANLISSIKEKIQNGQVTISLMNFEEEVSSLEKLVKASILEVLGFFGIQHSSNVNELIEELKFNLIGRISVLSTKSNNTSREEYLEYIFKWIIKKIHKTDTELMLKEAYESALSGELSDMHFVNLHRVKSLAEEINRNKPDSKLILRLNSAECELEKRMPELRKNENVYRLFNPTFTYKYLEVFRRILELIEFINLREFLRTSKLSTNLINKYCFFVGGASGTERIDGLACLKLKRKKFEINWSMDEKYIISSTALMKITRQTSSYTIFGKIHDVNKDENGRIIIDIRTLLVADPVNYNPLKPLIAYQRQGEECQEYLEEELGEDRWFTEKEFEEFEKSFEHLFQVKDNE
ncbi:hypothetical protein ACQKOD_24670 [Bacillus mycoides]|uniref:hypothetical protein n=1 Tax=Bacillus mycoides TaxID=1405 RepID=UPI003D06140A